MKKYIPILVLFFMLIFILYYFHGIYLTDNHIKKLNTLLHEHNAADIDLLFYEHSKLYIEDLEGQVKYEGDYTGIEEELKKYLSNQDMHISLSILEYTTKHNLYSVTVKNSLFFQNDINKNYGEMEYEIEFINIPFTSKIIKIRIKAT